MVVYFAGKVIRSHGINEPILPEFLMYDDIPADSPQFFETTTPGSRWVSFTPDTSSHVYELVTATEQPQQITEVVATTVIEGITQTDNPQHVDLSSVAAPTLIELVTATDSPQRVFGGASGSKPFNNDPILNPSATFPPVKPDCQTQISSSGVTFWPRRPN